MTRSTKPNARRDADLTSSASTNVNPDRESSNSTVEKDRVSDNGVFSALQTKNTKTTIEQGRSRKLPPFLDHFNARDLKTLCRCSIAFWVASLFVLIDPTLQAFGNAAFFSCIVVLILPPSGVVLVFLLGSVTMILGMSLAWAWGVIAMKAALATRPQAETLAREQLLAQRASTLSTPGYSPLQVLIFEGFMLDTRVSVTYFCMVGLFVYLMARLRARIPKLALTAVFAWVVSDIFLTIGPLIPTFNGTIPVVLIKPAAAAVAVNLACSLLIFPESTSHAALHSMRQLVTTMEGALDLTAGFLGSYPDTSHVEQMQALRSAIVGGWAKLEPEIGFLFFDVSFGHWNAEDIASLKEPIRRVVITSLSLLAFETLQGQTRERVKQFRPDDASSNDMKDESKLVYGKHQIMRSLNLLDAISQPEVGQSVSDSYQALSQASTQLLEACKDVFEGIAHSVHENNSRRWFGRLSKEEFAKMEQQHTAMLEKLRFEKAKFPTVANEALFASHSHLFDENGVFQNQASQRHKLDGMFFGFNFEDRLLLLASALETALEQIILLERERRTVRLWFPTGLRKLGSKFGAWVFGRTPTPAIGGASIGNMPQADKATIAELQQVLNRVQRPKVKRGLVSRIILGTGHWLSNDEGLYAFRVLLATVAAAVPAVCVSSAGFYYREKGLWALIMAQTGTASFSAEFSFGFVARISGTVAGGVLGMLGWYIGSGSGIGNPYGLAAVLAVYGVLLMWLRLYLPPQMTQVGIIGGSTLILVIGYGYIDTHLPSYGNPGWGYEVFWRRTLLVLTGFAISFIVSLIPWPSSLSHNLARRLSGVFSNKADHYAALLSSWKDLDTHNKYIPAVEAVTIQQAEILASLSGPIASLRFELSSSVFDSAKLSRIKTIAEYLNNNLAHLHMRAAKLSPDLRRRFARASGILDHLAVADVMVVLGLVAQSLKTGDALPARLPTPLVESCIRHGDGADVETLTVDVLKHEGYRGYCVCMSAYLGFLSGIDELVLAVKEAVGEAHHVPDDLKME